MTMNQFALIYKELEMNRYIPTRIEASREGDSLLSAICKGVRSAMSMCSSLISQNEDQT